jgi:hypothetical protein
MTVLVLASALGGQDPEARLMIRLMHRLVESLDERPYLGPPQPGLSEPGGR